MLSVISKFERLVVENHDASCDEGSKFRWVLPSKLVRFGNFGVTISLGWGHLLDNIVRIQSTPRISLKPSGRSRRSWQSRWSWWARWKIREATGGTGWSWREVWEVVLWWRGVIGWAASWFRWRLVSEQE